MALAQDNRGPMLADSGLTNSRVPVNPRLGMISQNVQGSSANQVIRVGNDSDEDDGGMMNGGSGRMQAPARGGMMGGGMSMQQPNRNQNVNMMMMQAKKWKSRSLL